MARDTSRFTVSISNKYKPKERRAIASDIINYIIERSGSGIDKDDKAFASGYSKGYAESVPGKAAGKASGQTPDLRLTGEMLESIEVVSSKNSELVIGYKKSGNKQLLKKAEGNILGTYGTQSPIKGKARDFMGISNTALSDILKKYPLNDKKKLEESTESTVQSRDFVGLN